jgi:hypothetical protein
MAIAAAAALIAVSASQTKAQAPLKTPWGEPDLQGIWTDEFETPLQRPAKYASQEFFTAAQRDALDRERTELLVREKRGEKGTETDVAGPRPRSGKPGQPEVRFLH